MRVPLDMQVGTKLASKNYGMFQIVEYKSAQAVTIKFLDTGAEVVMASNHIRRGAVRDPLRPVVCGVGYEGIGIYTKTRHGEHKKAYSVWSGMLKRCYSTNQHKLSPTYVDCTVCTEWHNFQNFAAWYYQNVIPGYHLDKDIIKDGNQVYCPEYCHFVPQAENSVKATAKFFTLVSPKGEQVKVYNLEKFCRDNDLSSASLRHVRQGKREHCKGWKLFTYGNV